jgi:hypothetical protein
MFERFEARAAGAAEAAAAERKARLAAQLRTILPGEIGVEATGDGVLLSGPGLERRLMLDSSLRWTIAGLLK